MKKQRERVQVNHDSPAGIVVQRDDAILRPRRFDGRDLKLRQRILRERDGERVYEKRSEQREAHFHPFFLMQKMHGLSLLGRIIR